MKNKLVLFRQYWELIRKEASQKASQKLGLSSRILAVIVAALAGLITAILRGGNTSEILLSILIGVVPALLIWLFIWLVCFYYYFLNEPAVIYNQQLNEINKLKYELTPDQAFDIKLRVPEYPQIGRINVGIDVRNISSLSVECSVSVKIKGMEYPVLLMPLLMHGEPREDLTTIKLTRNSTFPYYFACAGTGAGWPNAVLNTICDDSRRIFPGNYELTIFIEGESKSGKQITGSASFLLIYEGEDNLELRNL